MQYNFPNEIMGVYVFRCLHAPFVKVGHHHATPKRPNAYYRVAGRGFESIIHPEELNGKTYTEDLELVGWYPQLTRVIEMSIHRRFTTGKVGEFHRLEDLECILGTLNALGSPCFVSQKSREKAVRWGYRQVRRRRRQNKNFVKD